MLFMVGVIVYKLLIIHPLYENVELQPYANQVVSATGAVVNLIIIMILSKVIQSDDNDDNNGKRCLAGQMLITFIKYLCNCNSR